MRGISDSAVVA